MPVSAGDLPKAACACAVAPTAIMTPAASTAAVISTWRPLIQCLLITESWRGTSLSPLDHVCDAAARPDAGTRWRAATGPLNRPFQRGPAYGLGPARSAANHRSAPSRLMLRFTADVAFPAGAGSHPQHNSGRFHGGCSRRTVKGTYP